MNDATVETVDMPGATGDVADDSAIWRNPDHPEQSYVVGDNKSATGGGLAVYRLDGSIAHYVQAGGAIGNVDIRVTSIGGKRVVLVGANDRTANTLRFWSLDPGTGALTSIDARSISTAKDNYGFTLGTDPDGGHVYAIVTTEQGTLEQYELWATASGKVDATLVRTLSVGSISEGCVVDDATGSLYVAEEQVGIWRYDLAPGTGTARTSIDRVGGGHLTADVEGLTIARSGEGRSGIGVLIASSQGDSTLAVYDADNAHGFLRNSKFRYGADDVTSTDGVSAAVGDFGPAFPYGLVVVHDSDDQGPSGSKGTTSNLKFVPIDKASGSAAVAATGSTSPVTASSTSTTTAPTTATTTTASAPRNIQGTVVQTKYGAVQVAITVQGTRITSADAVRHPTGDENDSINARAVPTLNTEAVTAQSAQIDAVSGATITSNAYKQSLQAAIDTIRL